MDDWQTLRNAIIRETSDVPGAHLEDELIARYHDNPQTVEHAAEKILTGYRAGKIRSPWGALKAEIGKAFDPANNPTHDRSTSRKKAIERAEQWIKTAGLHFDRWTEIQDELFGERGPLQAHHTPELEQRIEGLWREHRPIGELVEAEHEAFMARYQEQRETALKPKKAA